mgnify:CR=1 FL=1
MTRSEVAAAEVEGHIQALRNISTEMFARSKTLFTEARATKDDERRRALRKESSACEEVAYRCWHAFNHEDSEVFVP